MNIDGPRELARTARAARMLLVLLAAVVVPPPVEAAPPGEPSTREATTRVSLSISKSFHPGSARDYSTVHPGLGATGRLAGEWLRWRAGVVRHSHSRWGPVAGLAATWGVAESWRMGLSAGVIGNYARGHWFRRGVLPIVQWTDRERELVWEFALARNEKVTFVGVNLEIPISMLATRPTR